MMKLALTAIVLPCFVIPLAAQRTWVVDAARGKGYDYAKIQDAVNAAKAGDNIVVRAGSYRSFSVSKGVRVLAASGVKVNIVHLNDPPVTVNNLPARQSVVLRGFTVLTTFVPDTSIHVSGNKGIVHLDRLVLSKVSIGPDPSLVLVGNTAVTLHGCDVSNGMSVESSSVMASDCRFTNGLSLFYPGYGIYAKRSSLTLAGCIVTGGDAHMLFALPAVEAILGSTVRLLGDSRSIYTAGKRVMYDVYPVVGDSSSRLEIDPRVTLVPWRNATGHVGFGKVTTAQRPFLSATGGQLGKTLEVIEHGTKKGEIFAILVSLPSSPIATPFGDLWIDSAAALPMLVGSHGSNPVARLRLTVPTNPALRGIPLAWQALGGPPSRIVTTNAIVTTLY